MSRGTNLALCPLQGRRYLLAALGGWVQGLHSPCRIPGVFSLVGGTVGFNQGAPSTLRQAPCGSARGAECIHGRLLAAAPPRAQSLRNTPTLPGSSHPAPHTLADSLVAAARSPAPEVSLRQLPSRPAVDAPRGCCSLEIRLLANPASSADSSNWVGLRASGSFSQKPRNNRRALEFAGA